MADAIWTQVGDGNGEGFDTWKATINSTDVKTKVLKLKSGSSKSTIFINIGAGEAAIQIKGHNNSEALEEDLIVLSGADAISTDFDDELSAGVSALQFIGAVTANDTVITVTEVG